MDLVDLGVVGDGLERDVGNALVDKPLLDIALVLPVRWHLSGDFGFLLRALDRVVKEVVRKPGRHQAGAGKSNGYPGGVDGDPAAPPLLGDIGGGAAATRWVEHQVAGIGGHQETTLHNLSAVCTT